MTDYNYNYYNNILINILLRLPLQVQSTIRPLPTLITFQALEVQKDQSTTITCINMFHMQMHATVLHLLQCCIPDLNLR